MLETNLWLNCIYNNQDLLACEPIIKHHERIQKFRETDSLNHIYENKLNEVCFLLDARYYDSEDLAKKTVSDKDKAYEIAINPEYDKCQRGITSIAYKLFDKKTELGRYFSRNESTS